MASDVPSWELVLGARIAGYVLTESLADGPRTLAWRARSEHRDWVLVFVSTDTLSSEVARYPTHPGLAPIVEILPAPVVESPGTPPERVASWTVIVTAYESGPSLDEWVTENTSASAPQRLAVLRMIASAIDALHAVDLAHGNVTPFAVRVPEVGTAILTQPMLTTDVTKSDDVLDFLRLAFGCLTGSEPSTDSDPVLDFGRLRAQLLAAPDLRRRPVLAQRLAEAMVMPADARPTSLRRWLDRAAAAAATETVAGPTAAPITTTPNGADGTDSNRRVRRQVIVASAAVAVAAAITVTAISITGSRHAPASTKPPASPVAAAAITASGTWPMKPGCDDTTQVALPDALGARANFGPDPRIQMISRAGGAWQQGTLTITVDNPTSRPALLLGLDPHRVNAIVDPPAWLYRPAATHHCPAQAPAARSYVFDVDHWSMHSPDATATNAQGAYLPIAAGARVTLRMTASNCTTNVRFVVDVRLSVAGSSTGQDFVLPTGSGSYTIDAVGDHTDVYEGTNIQPEALATTPSTCTGVEG